ncbi:hypothetical protein [Mycobacterium canetti]|uniref:hypothetical protein n=1 Tax=Mycobacterium canetti TaxID=78331 RepID=UPI00059B1D34|nr:hypothetical protein [Mycobacterium canetti]
MTGRHRRAHGALGTVRGLQNSNTAFVGALHSGNLLGATGAVLQAPGNAVNGFLFGQTAISQSIDVSPEYGYESVAVSDPVGGTAGSARAGHGYVHADLR